MRDTIYALSSAPGRAGVAVVRLSGPAAGTVLEALTGKPLPPPRRARPARLMDRTGAAIDDALVLWFAAPASFTGEDVAEFHLHGGRAILDALFAALADRPGLRPAEPGEFTRRAVENGKLDLTRAEAIADLIDAETESQRRQALRQYEGALARMCEDWRARLVAAAAWIEAGIDFADEELPDGLGVASEAKLRDILQEIQSVLKDAHKGEIVRSGVHLTLFGEVNAGKSSLLNALARRDVAIVSPTPGTTRDVIEVRLDLGGYAVIVSDTAGLRTGTDAIEAEGVRRALERARSADVAVLVADGTVSLPAPLPSDVVPDLIVWNKSDLAWPVPHDGLRVSAKTGAGLDRLLESLSKIVAQKLDTQGIFPSLTRERHRHALAAVATHLALALKVREPELVAEELRMALRGLGRITGRVDIEELLDVVFRDFCIGK
ncbi:MAG TPA: tRNA uridine-5-carboxymethylaminomethyl(34) synthesis GTPase MnmE [Rhizomicrobium sp.]|nr:tRNA uridine-5-carboxymethylaminomethyl(34) synthesis GTPase MnmE [Rhizomicrobium sp.]